MADKPKNEAPAPAAAPKGSSATPILMAVCAVLLAIVVALVVFMFVLRPKLGAVKEGGGETKQSDAKPEKTVTVSFDEAFATVKMPSADVPASTLLYKVTIECSDQATADKIDKNKARFTAMIRQMHSYRERASLDDPQAEKSIERQIQEEASKMLKDIPDEENAEHKSDEKSRVTAVYHEKFFVQDM